MSNSVIPLNPGTGGLDMDAELLAGQGPGGVDVYRERVQITGDTLAEIAKVLNSPPTGSEYGLVVRALLAVGQQVMANSTPVVIASDQTAIPVTVSGGTTVTVQQLNPTAAAITKVAVNAVASVQLFAPNTAAKGRKIYNDSSTSTLLVKEGTTAGADDFSFPIPPKGYYEYAAGCVYDGEIDGIWTVADAAGKARCTEET